MKSTRIHQRLAEEAKKRPAGFPTWEKGKVKPYVPKTAKQLAAEKKSARHYIQLIKRTKGKNADVDLSDIIKQIKANDPSDASYQPKYGTRGYAEDDL